VVAWGRADGVCCGVEGGSGTGDKSAVVGAEGGGSGNFGWRSRGLHLLHGRVRSREGTRMYSLCGIMTS
jgi:hypothetical protein